MMKKAGLVGFVTMVLWGLLGSAVSVRAADSTQPPVLVDFGKDFDAASVEKRDASAYPLKTGPSGALHVVTGRATRWPGVAFNAPKGKWDLSSREYIALDLKNADDEPVTVTCRVDCAATSPSNTYLSASVTLNPKAAETLRVRLYPTAIQLTEPVEFIGMRRGPAEPGKIDPSKVTRLMVFVPQPHRSCTFDVANVRAEGQIKRLATKDFFPFIDEFGQFIHKDWPGKCQSVAEIVAQGKAEEKDLAAHPGPQDRDQYGGWTAGPKLEATGFFRVEKHQGKWWLVDPAGRLFWSHGIDCVRSAESTPINGREKYFSSLPTPDSPFAKFYGAGRGAAHGSYQNVSQYRTYDFSKANLLRKYGSAWGKDSAELAHRRLKSWGMNTIANWSDTTVALMRKTPYTATVGGGGRRIEGSEGYWGKFPDPFDPEFRESFGRRMESEKGRSAGDPWCLGYFVHNELGWGDEVSLALAALKSPADQPAKKAFVEDLKARYNTIEKLNAAWGTTHASWDALLQSVEPPDKKKAWDDLTAFYTRIAETYFQTIRDEVKRAAPNQLYLGCRFAWVNDRAARAAAKFCDIVAYNRYTYTVEKQRLPDGLDKPIIIGEFHFGALDRGMFHPGLKETADQQDRANTYKKYVEGALRNPCIVGTHWFQYKDQATTGRSDGENYQIGFVDICDTPYPETIQACREVGYGLYEYRLKN